jgi:protocatechuate 3,4-dioxygenase beta subunit
MSSRVVIGIVVVLAVGAVASGLVWWTRPAVAPTVPAERGAPPDAAPTPEKAAPSSAEAELPEPEAASETANAATPSEEAEPSLLRVSGVVTDAATGEAVPGAQVAILTEGRAQRFARLSPFAVGRGDDPESLAQGETDAQGAYALEVTADRDLFLICRATGFAEAEEKIAKGAGPEMTHDFALKPGATVAGRVVDPSGAGLEGVTVVVASYNPNFMEMAQAARNGAANVYEARTDADGNYRTEGIDAGTFRVTPRAGDEGYILAATNPTVLNVEAGKAYEDVNFTLEPGGVVRGVITNAAGEPVAGARPRLTPEQFVQAAMDGMRDQQMDVMFKVGERTDETGAFEIKGLRYDTSFRLRVEAEDYAEGLSEPFTIARDPGAVEVNLTLTAGSTVSGRVRLADGTPAVDCAVMVMPSMESIFAGAMSEPKRGKTDDKGEFSIIAVAAGKYTVTAGDFNPMMLMARGDNPAQVKIEANGADPVTNIELVLADKKSPGKDAFIKGIVIDVTGKPVNNASVTARRVDGPPDRQNQTTGSDGSFAFEGLEGKLYTVTATADAGRAEQKNVKIGQRLSMRLDPPAAIRGRVEDAKGQPVEGARVSLRKAGTPSRNSFASMMEGFGGGRGPSATSDKTGAFAFENIEPATYTVSAQSAADGQGESTKVKAVAGRPVEDVVVRLTEGVRVSGRVRDKSGRPVAGATVRLVRSDDEGASLWMMQAAGMQGGHASTSGGDGSYEILQVPEGTYMLTATASGYAGMVPRQLRVLAGRDATNQDVTLTAGARVHGQVAPNAMFQLIGEGGMYMVTADAQGNVNLANVTPGRYMLQAIDPNNLESMAMGGMMNASAQVVDVPEEGDFEIPLAPQGPAAVSGSIAGADPGNFVTVSLRRPGGPAPEEINVFSIGQIMDAVEHQAGQAVIGADGNFNIDGLEPGTYILEVFNMDIDMDNLDFEAMMEMSRTPQIRQEVTVTADQPLQLNFNLE